MMTHSKTWQASSNPANLAVVIPMQKNAGTSANKASSGKQPVIKLKATAPKRYSIDDNGGGYEGL